jgi:hypothetical protein
MSIHLYKVYLKAFDYVSAFYTNYLSRNCYYIYCENLVVKFWTIYYLGYIAAFELIAICFKLIAISLKCAFSLIKSLKKKVTIKSFLWIFFFMIIFSFIFINITYAEITFNLESKQDNFTTHVSNLFWFKYFYRSFNNASKGFGGRYATKKLIDGFVDNPIMTAIALHSGVIAFMPYTGLVLEFSPNIDLMDNFNSFAGSNPSLDYYGGWLNNCSAYLTDLIDLQARRVRLEEEERLLIRGQQELEARERLFAVGKQARERLFAVGKRNAIIESGVGRFYSIEGSPRFTVIKKNPFDYDIVTKSFGFLKQLPIIRS